MTSPDFKYDELMELLKIDSYLLKELCNRFLWIFCQILAPDFYNSEHCYLKIICDRLQTFLEDQNRKYFVLSIPPQHGKSRTITMMELWVMLKNKKIRFFSISYNEDYAIEASKALLTAIKQQPEDGIICFQDIAGGSIRVKKGDGAINRWSLDGGYSTWLSSSPGAGGVTGKSANIIVIDDIIKDYYTATNKRELSKIWTWYSNTLFSRKGDNNQKTIIVMTRWAKHDLAGEILARFPDADNLVMKAYNPETDSMLCPAILNKSSYNLILKVSSPDLVESNYNQRPIDIKGSLYTHFNTYKDLSDIKNKKRTVMLCDTADEGSDWLCGILFEETYDHRAYITDVLYTKESVETTIPQTAKFIYNRSSLSIFESNNGGKIFALSVRNELRTKFKSNQIIKWFHQSKNKEARIISTAYDVMNKVYFPEDWKQRWPEFATDLCEYQREGNEHDDCADVMTMIAEYLNAKLKTR